jgi:DNA-binding MurR/RpiR family transcriptional regulator
MEQRQSFSDRAAAATQRLSAAELAVIRFFQENREEVLVASAAALASRIGTSDATVIRAAQALGYAGLDDLRRHLADELRVSLSPAARMARTLGAVKSEGATALAMMIDIHFQALEGLRRDINVELFDKAINLLVKARRVVIFGIGPSSALADYFSIQLGRFGVHSKSLTQTGLLLADGLHCLKQGDLVIALAYSRVYREIQTLLAQADHLRVPSILLTDTLGATLERQVDLVLPVARGNADWFSTHTATLGLIEALLVGVATKRPTETVASLNNLNMLRSELAGEKMELPVGDRHRTQRRRKRG